jgi:hypothetical protein
MDLMGEFKELLTDLDRLRAEMTALEKSTDQAGLRDILMQAGLEWEEHIDKLTKAFPEAVAEIHRELAGVQSMLDEARSTAEEAERKVAEIPEEAVEEPPLVSTLEPPDGLGLRDELLGQFGIPRTTAAVRPETLGSVADLASGSFASSDSTPAPSKPTPARPQTPHPEAKPRKDKNKDNLWEMTSGDWSADE